MKTQITRFTCDAPDCEDVADIESPVATATTAIAAPDRLPDGWVELAVTGSSPGGEQQLVHASKPECAAALATDQVEQAVEAGKQREKEEEERRQRSEEMAEEARQNAEEEQRQRSKEAAEKDLEDAEEAELPKDG